MTQFSTQVRNAIADVVESTIGASPIMRILSGTMPANCAAAQTGTLLAELTLPSDWLTNASGGSKSLSGVWQDASANNGGTFGYYRILDSAGSTCHAQGTVGTSGAEMIVTSASIAAGESFTVTSGTLTTGNA